MAATFVGRVPRDTLGINDVKPGEFYVVTAAPTTDWVGALIMGTVLQPLTKERAAVAITVSSASGGFPLPGTLWLTSYNAVSLRRVGNVTISE